MEHEKDEKKYLDINLIVSAFERIKKETFGSTEDKLHETELAKFIDRFCTCSLKDPMTVDIVKSVNVHNCTKSCHKYGPECRFGAPWFPSLRTIIAVPHNIRYPDSEVAEKALRESKLLLKRVKDVLEVDVFMESVCREDVSAIDQFMKHKKIVSLSNDVVGEIESGECILWKDLENELQTEYTSHFSDTPGDFHVIDAQHFFTLIEFHEKCISDLNLEKIFEKRLDKILLAARVEGDNAEQRIRNYENALSISDKRYAVVVKRDVDELRVNLYNPEWIIAGMVIWTFNHVWTILVSLHMLLITT